jgi:hypothetical protein
MKETTEMTIRLLVLVLFDLMTLMNTSSMASGKFLLY